MKPNCFWICLLMSLLCVSIQAQTKKFDTTVKMGDQGYRVQCSNKNADKNTVSVSPIGLKTDGPDPSFGVYGRVTKVFIDDLNDDGRPDLMICIFGGDNNEIGTIAALSYNANKSFEPIYFPDIYLDSKIREGYKGHDEFSGLTGTLLRKFPIYLPGDSPDKATGGMRVVQYKAMMENGHLSFKVLRWYDVKQ